METPRETALRTIFDIIGLPMALTAVGLTLAIWYMGAFINDRRARGISERQLARVLSWQRTLKPAHLGISISFLIACALRFYYAMPGI